MNGKQLKNSILQWAIQGRLVLDHETDKTLAEIQRILGVDVNMDEL